MATQKDKIKEHLLKGKTLTPLQALNLYGSMRLAAVVHKLKNEGDGMDIKTTIMTHPNNPKKQFAKYYIQYPQQSLNL